MSCVLIGHIGRWAERKLTRDAFLAALGAYGMVTEIRAAQADEIIVLASLALLGAPIVLRADERRSGSD